MQNRFMRSPVSFGPSARTKGVTVPSLLGMDLDDAALELSYAGLGLGRAIVPDHGHPEGVPRGSSHIVVYQNPPPGTVVPRGSCVDLYGGHIWR